MHLCKRRKRSIWIMRDRSEPEQPNMVMFDSSNNSSMSSEDEFINHQEKSYDIF